MAMDNICFASNLPFLKVVVEKVVWLQLQRSCTKKLSGDSSVAFWFWISYHYSTDDTDDFWWVWDGWCIIIFFDQQSSLPSTVVSFWIGLEGFEWVSWYCGSFPSSKANSLIAGQSKSRLMPLLSICPQSSTHSHTYLTSTEWSHPSEWD